MLVSNNYRVSVASSLTCLWNNSVSPKMTEGGPVFGNVFVGLFLICLQIFTLVTNRFYLDFVSTGIWGGVYLLMFAYLLKTKKIDHKIAVVIMAVYAILVGVSLIGIHSWNINYYRIAIEDCESYIFLGTTLCNRVAIDSLMIVCGILTVIINFLVIAKASVYDYTQFI